MTDTPLKLFNSLTRELEEFIPVHPGEARVYSCGPTVYNYQHIGNMRAYVFADTLGRTLRWKGYKLTHVVNITDVGHLTSDADEGEDKMERMAAKEGKSAWDIARFYQDDFERDLGRLNVQPKQHPRATEYVEAMIAWGTKIAPEHCYELDSGLYFDVSTVADYGRLARAVTEEGAEESRGRIDTVEGKRNAADFAIWRKTPAGETRQMEWDSPWGKGAPGWHLECSVMGEKLLGFPFDIHTGGIDHREIHHPNEIAQNQAFCGCGGLDEATHSGAKIWMHNNFLVERSGKMSKSSGEFLRLQLLVDKGYHPLAYRMMCLQAHYRSELEFSWEGLGAALTRLKRIERAYSRLLDQFEEKHSNESLPYPRYREYTVEEQLTHFGLLNIARQFSFALSDDLNTPEAIKFFEEALRAKRVPLDEQITLVRSMRYALGLPRLTPERFRLSPTGAMIRPSKVNEALKERKLAKEQGDYQFADQIREALEAVGVEVMDGDPLGWEWKL
ncbi:cysteine--tRNA ligase [Qipengyuania flava]|uniref:cysteine--tRNA ligase n=1 Tax=Qipengyuania flava TaxID=192812 RepID=UPI00273FCD48|nr:cysteine--tRNA ligase [Qipengyuania flava]